VPGQGEVKDGRVGPRWRVAFATALWLAVSPQESRAFNPNPRPVPAAAGGAAAVCADDPGVACQSNDAAACASGTCIVDPAAAVPGVAVRGTLTVITDEDVTGWDEGADASAERAANARLTLLLQYERGGALRSFAETYRLNAQDCGGGGGGGGSGTGGGTGGGGGTGTGGGAGDAEVALCVPSGVGWNQPASEEVITDPQLNLVFSVLGARAAHAVAVDLTGDPNTTATPFLDVVDRLPETTSNHTGSDPLASAQQLKVTIRLLP
jgi:hypothetical protein